MTVFTKEKMDIIRVVAQHARVPESTDAKKAGVFYDITTRLIIDTRYKSEYFSDMPKVGLMDETDDSIEETRAKTCVDIRTAIADGFAKLPKFVPKEHDKKEEPKLPQAPEAVNEKEHPKTQEVKAPVVETPKPEPKKTMPVKIISCCVCGIEIPHAEALKQSEDGIRPAEMKHADCEAKKPEQKEGKVMIESKEVIPVKPGANAPAKISDYELDMKIEKEKVKRYLETQAGSYTVNGNNIPDSAGIQKIANEEGISVQILESEQTKDYARVRVRGTLGNQSVDGEVWIDFFTETQLLMMEFINKNKGVLDHFEGLNPVFVEGAQIKQGDYFVDAKYALVHATLTLRKFAIRTANTKASKIVQMKLLNKEFREKEEIAEEQAEKDLIGKSKNR